MEETKKETRKEERRTNNNRNKRRSKRNWMEEARWERRRSKMDQT